MNNIKKCSEIKNSNKNKWNSEIIFIFHWSPKRRLSFTNILVILGVSMLYFRWCGAHPFGQRFGLCFAQQSKKRDWQEAWWRRWCRWKVEVNWIFFVKCNMVFRYLIVSSINTNYLFTDRSSKEDQHMSIRTPTAKVIWILENAKGYGTLLRF